ncbi:MAG: sulfotransferase [Hahellaceae bacterium]|nr:sulfotransferase [Hahellaceae bacterium]MCP5211731.1 sulfotransferase [Hahellaceae bacterium]
MKQDPHELSQRRPPWLKNEQIDQYLEKLNNLLAEADLDNPKTGDKPPKDLPLIYVVSAPRSGGTLLSQVLCKHLDVGYIDNIAARFWLRPSAGINLSKSIRNFTNQDHISFSSYYGRTKGPLEPNEFGYFWRHWFNLDTSINHKLSNRHLSNIDIFHLRATLRNEILAAFGKAVVLKNPICGLQANFLTKVHPKTLFVYIKRNPYDVAVSIMNARKTHYGDYSSWWSLKPSNYPDFINPLSPADEVFDQVIQCNKDLEHELNKRHVNSITLNYDELCRSPEMVLDHITASISAMNYSCTKLNLSTLQPFVDKSEISIPNEFKERLKKRADELEHK